MCGGADAGPTPQGTYDDRAAEHYGHRIDRNGQAVNPATGKLENIYAVAPTDPLAEDWHDFKFESDQGRTSNHVSLVGWAPGYYTANPSTFDNFMERGVLGGLAAIGGAAAGSTEASSAVGSTSSATGTGAAGAGTSTMPAATAEAGGASAVEAGAAGTSGAAGTATGSDTLGTIKAIAPLAAAGANLLAAGAAISQAQNADNQAAATRPNEVPERPQFPLDPDVAALRKKNALLFGADSPSSTDLTRGSADTGNLGRATLLGGG